MGKFSFNLYKALSLQMQMTKQMQISEGVNNSILRYNDIQDISQGTIQIRQTGSIQMLHLICYGLGLDCEGNIDGWWVAGQQEDDDGKEAPS